MKQTLINFLDELSLWGQGWRNYIDKKLRRWGKGFERYKDIIVDLLIARRGTYQRPFLHFSLGILFIVGVVSAPILANAYPGGIPKGLADFTPPSAVLTSLDVSEYGIETKRSEKPRDQVVTYVVEKGDTLSSIAEKFGILIDTIKWANDIKRDSLNIGDELKIPPVTGIVHKVREGETIYTIAKRYKTESQKIVNFPFNDFTDLDTFALNVGQTLIVPDGVMPEAAPIRTIPIPPVFAGGTGQFQWPVSGLITQYPVWYHNALDIANPAAPGIAAAANGVVTDVEYLRYGYGQHVTIDNGDGLSTLYAHLSEIYVKAGDSVGRGQIIGRMGSTGRSSGTHLHFEVRKGGITVNPLSFLK
ncbi:M23 family metallopeptidase [Candidatus Gottesmanbacteria bacterium]|nr:M23 family metallopeptidase [Candidatus Gottesmanbacteria bacterium]